MIIIKTLPEFKKHKDYINNLYKTFGKIYFHNPLSIESTFVQKKGKDFFVVIDYEDNIVTAFEKKQNGICQCDFNGYPFLVGANTTFEHVSKFLQKLKFEINVNTIYFPLLYKNDLFVRYFIEKQHYPFNNRLSCPIVKGKFDTNTIWGRVKLRYGSRAEKQKKKFETCLTTKSLSNVDVKKILIKIEKSSWKSKFNQDMISRDNQIDYYSSLIKLGLAQITFALDHKGIPIAYRIDSMVNKVLYVLKWSYDENYRKYSPGFYLLTIDLFRNLKISKLKYIDLYGSPDSLKQLIETDRLERVDIFLSNRISEVQQIINERREYDDKIANNLEKRQSLKNLFDKKT